MVAGIGIDIVDIGRIKKAINKFNHLESRIFTDNEIEYCRSKQNPYLHFAVRFAAKEAAAKALGTGFRGFKLKDLSVTKNGEGKPSILLKDNALKAAKTKNIGKIELSLSFSHNQAVAVAIAIMEN